MIKSYNRSRKLMCILLVLLMIIQNFLPYLSVEAENVPEEISSTTEQIENQKETKEILLEEEKTSIDKTESTSDNTGKKEEEREEEEKQKEVNKKNDENQKENSSSSENKVKENNTSNVEEKITKIDYSERKEISAADAQGNASLNKNYAKDLLSDLPNVDDNKEASLITKNIFPVNIARSSSSPELIDGIERSGDGSNIESILAKWITVDTVDNNNESLLYIKPEKDEKQTVVLQINYALSGEHNYEPGDITITIPTSFINKREGNEAGKLIIPYAEDPSKKNDFNWKQVGNTFVITNTKKMSAATKGYIQFSVSDIIPHEITDMGVSEAFNATIEVTTHKGNTIGLKSNSLKAQFDTEAKITDVKKHVSGDPQRISAEEIPENQRIEGEDEYIKVNWYVYGNITSNTMYTLLAEDTIPEEYDGFIIDGTSSLKDEKELYHGYSDGRTSYYQYATAYPASQFKEDTDYIFHNNIKFTVTEDDPAAEVVNPNVGEEDPKLVTVKTDSAQTTFRYSTPVWRFPTGHFMIFKNGNDDTEKNNTMHRGSANTTDLHAWSRSYSGYYGIYPSGLNELKDKEDIRLSYTVNSVGYAMPWMFDDASFTTDGEIASRLSKNYTKSVSMVTEDNGISLTRSGQKLTVLRDYDFVEIGFPETPWVYTGTPQNINPDGSFKAMTAGDGTFLYEKDDNVSHIPDIDLEFQMDDGDWVKVATASWKNGSRVVSKPDGTIFSNGIVPAPEGTINFRTKTVLENTGNNTDNIALQAAIDYDVRAVISLKSTNELQTAINLLFDHSNTPQWSIWNEVQMQAFCEDEEITTLSADGYDSVRGYTTDISVYPQKSSKQTMADVDFENQRLTIHYSAKVEEVSLIHDKKTYQQAVEDGRILLETHGIWRDLLPKGVVPVLSTIKLRDKDRITDTYTIENYKNSGRTLLVVEGDLTPYLQRTLVKDVYCYEDVPSITFDAFYDFEALTDYGKTLHNVISFESSNPYIGTQEDYSGEPDDPHSANNTATASACTDEEKEWMENLNPDHDNPSFVYAGVTTKLDVITGGRTSLSKDVMTNNDGWWSDGLYYNNPEVNKRTVYEGGIYSYRLRMVSDADTVSKDLILYDSLENFYAGSGNDEIDIDAPRWQGVLKDVDVSQLEKAGCVPVVYYSTVENLQLSDEDNPDRANATNVDLDNSSVWIKAEDYEGEMNDVKAIAVDASKKADGTDFMLDPKESVVVIINMRAPSGEDARRYISQKGVWGDSAHAYNNSYLLCTSLDAATMQTLDSDNFVRKDYTKVGLMEFEIKAMKTWNDEENQDGKRPSSVTMHLYANGTDTGKAITLPVIKEDLILGVEVPCWETAFEHVPYTDENGQKIHYSVKEENVPGYDVSIRQDEDTFKVVNTHEPEKITVSGKKTWEDENGKVK